MVYTSTIIGENESYLLELTRCIVLNPIRAGMVKSPQDEHTKTNTRGHPLGKMSIGGTKIFSQLNGFVWSSSK